MLPFKSEDSSIRRTEVFAQFLRLKRPLPPAGVTQSVPFLHSEHITLGSDWPSPSPQERVWHDAMLCNWGSNCGAKTLSSSAPARFCSTHCIQILPPGSGLISMISWMRWEFYINPTIRPLLRRDRQRKESRESGEWVARAAALYSWRGKSSSLSLSGTRSPGTRS